MHGSEGVGGSSSSAAIPNDRMPGYDAVPKIVEEPEGKLHILFMLHPEMADMFMNLVQVSSSQVLLMSLATRSPGRALAGTPS
jgi:hypothetical protein